jgi:hypothetical protein
MCRQYAQPLSCDAWIWTSSTSAGSGPSRAAASKPMRALNACGADAAKSTRKGRETAVPFVMGLA